MIEPILVDVVNKDVDSIPQTKTVVAAEAARDYRERRLRIIFLLIAVVLGALHAWTYRHIMNADGISYLDIGDAYFRGEWSTAINGYWSPFYPWLLGFAMSVLKPSSYWEFTVAHLVNFAIYLFALGCFDFFLRELIRYHEQRTIGFFKDGRVTLPRWAWLALGYTLFIWSSLYFTGINLITPDILVSGFLYLVSGILLRIRNGARGWLTFVALGAVLGLSYLARAPMFFLAFVFLALSVFAIGNLRKAAPRVLVAVVAFLLIASPFIIALSISKGRLTFSDAGRLNYIWIVNGVFFRHWQGDENGSRRPLHPTRKIFDAPAVYEFGSPVGGTYPPWYDMSYWYEGVKPIYSVSGQIRRLVTGVKFYYYTLYSFNGFQLYLLVGLLTLLAYMGRRRWFGIRDMAEHWNLFIPAIAGLLIYALIHIEQRYVAAFILLLWVAAFSGVRLPDSQESRKVMASVTIALVATMMIALCFPAVPKAYAAARDVIKGSDASAHEHWQVADGLHRMGIQAGDQVAFTRESQYVETPTWARLAKVRVVAEMPNAGSGNAWTADQTVEPQIIEAFARTGAKVIVAKSQPRDVSGWQRIGNTDYYAYIL